MGQDLSTDAHAGFETMKKYTGFSAKQVIMIKDRFDLICDDDQSVDQNFFTKLMKIQSEETEKIFTLFDQDHSGRINSYEFISGLALLSQSKLQDKADIVFDLYDFDKSQVISVDELIILMKTVLTALHAMKKKKPPTLNNVAEKSKAIMGRWDMNKDGFISKSEFRSFVSKDRDVIKLLTSCKLLNKEELRVDFGGSDFLECDSDLENELTNFDYNDNERSQQIKLGIEYDIKEKNSNHTAEPEEVEDNHQIVVKKPWLETIKSAVPGRYIPQIDDADAPEANLELEHIYGYRCHNVRNNLRYTANGNIVYHTAAVGVLLSGNEKAAQKFYIEHTNDITCLDVHEDLVVTGQAGPKPMICIWKYETATEEKENIPNKIQNIAIFQGDLQNTITQVCFSNSRKKLAAVSNDEDHTVCIYDLEKLLNVSYNKVKAKTDGSIIIGKSTRAGVFDAKFDPNEQMLILACLKEINFISFDGNVIKCVRGTGWTKNSQAILCIGFIDQTVITGTFKGSLFMWKGKSLSNVVEAHTGAVNAIWTRKKPKGIITGGNDGLIFLWDHNMKKIHTFDFKNAEMTINYKVRSICEYPSENPKQILIGTRGGEIIEFTDCRRDDDKSAKGPDYKKPKILMKSHFNGELWGLAVHPKRNEFVTVGEDQLLASWDVTTRKQKKSIRIEYPAKVLAYSPDEKFFCVGCKNGYVLVLNPNTNFSTIQVLKDRNREISELKFSANSELLAVGGHDSEIFIYEVKKEFKIQSKMKGHNSIITHFDFSVDSSVVQSNSAAYELSYYYTKTGKKNHNGAYENRDTTWSTWTCVFGWPVQGIWPEYSDYSDVNSLDRHPTDSVVATGDNFSKVKLFKYPCPVKKAGYVKVVGHSSKITKVRFTTNGNHLISIGGKDKTVFQWRYTSDKSIQQGVTKDAQHKEDGEGEEIKEDKVDHPIRSEEYNEEEGVVITRKEVLTKEQAEQNWPSLYQNLTEPGEVPDGNLILKYCHGYNSSNTRNTVRYSTIQKEERERNDEQGKEPEIQKEKRADKSGDKIVFVASTLGVVMNAQSKKQKFFHMHREDINSLAVSPNGKYAATGQIAQKGDSKRVEILIWEIETRTVISRINDFHIGAIALITFSPNGSKLFSIGSDEDNSLAIYDWSQPLLLTTIKVDKHGVNGIACRNEDEFMMCGQNFVKFYTINGKNIKAEFGISNTTQEPEAFLCVVYAFSKIPVCGTKSGNLIHFNGTNPGNPVRGHEGEVLTLRAHNETLYSGGRDGKVIVWSWISGLSKLSTYCDMARTSKFSPQIISLDVRADGNAVLVGTSSSEVYEVYKDGKSDILLQGHYDGKLWGCAVSPDSMKYVTCGADKTVRLWDAEESKMIASAKLEKEARAIHWAPNGLYIVTADIEGKIFILDPNPKEFVAKEVYKSPFLKSGQWIKEIKISPNSSIIAFGVNNQIEIINFEDDKGEAQKNAKSKNVLIYSEKEKWKANKSPIDADFTGALVSVDWSDDSSFMVVSSQAGDLKYLRVTGEPVMAEKTERFNWVTWTSQCGVPVQGIFQSVDSSGITTVCRAQNRKILATGDESGKINLFKFPSVDEHAQCKSYVVHSSPVTKVQFTIEDTYLISTGGRDRCVLVWATDFGANDEAAKSIKESKESPQIEDDEYKLRLEEEESQCVQQKVKKDKYEKKQIEYASNDERITLAAGDLFRVEKVEGGDEYLAVKPWYGAIKEPTGWRKPALDQNKPPKIDLELEFVHGYRVKDCRNNLRYLKNGNIVYHAARLGIVMDITTYTQRFFKEHTDDITAIDVHPNEVLVATGQLGLKPEIFIWDSNSLQTIWKFQVGLQKGIAALSFSPSGNRLAGVDIDESHHIAVYDVKTGILLSSEKGGNAKVFDLKFKNDNELVSVGPKHLKFWNFENRQVTSKRGQFNGAINLLRCVIFNENDCLVGDAKGCLQIWEGTSNKDKHQIHEGGIDCISLSKLYVVTAGVDGNIGVISKNKTKDIYEVLYKISFENVTKTSLCPKIRSVCFSSDHKSLLVGTYGSEIYEISTKDSKNIEKPRFSGVKEIIKGHFTPQAKQNNEVWGLAVFNDEDDRWCTCSDDGTLRIWSISKRRQLKSIKLDMSISSSEPNVSSNPIPADTKAQDSDDSLKGRSLDVSKDNKYIAVGCRDGTLRVFEVDTSNNLKQIHTSKVAKEWIQELKFSPNVDALALGSHDNSIYILGVPDFKKKSTLKKHSSFITHLDWSCDGKYLHSNCRGYELLFWDAITGKQITSEAKSLRNESWATWTCVLGWPVQGIWSSFTSGDDINYVCRSPYKTTGGYELLVCADDFGRVKVLRYPSIEKGSEAVVGVGHSSYVTCTKFGAKNEVLFSSGGEDNCVFQWKVSSIVKDKDNST